MRFSLLGTFALLLPAVVSAQSITTAEYAARRDSLAARIDSGVVVAFGGRKPVGFARPGQLPAFRYLTGFIEPDAALVMVVRQGKPTSTLFTEARDPRRALYDGFPPDSAAGRPADRDAGPRAVGASRRMLDSLAGTGLPFYTLRDFATADAAETDSLTRGAHFMRGFAEGHPGLDVARRAPDPRQPSHPEESRRNGDAAPRDRHDGGGLPRGRCGR